MNQQPVGYSVQLYFFFHVILSITVYADKVTSCLCQFNLGSISGENTPYKSSFLFLELLELVAWIGASQLDNHIQCLVMFLDKGTLYHSFPRLLEILLVWPEPGMLKNSCNVGLQLLHVAMLCYLILQCYIYGCQDHGNHGLLENKLKLISVRTQLHFVCLFFFFLTFVSIV